MKRITCGLITGMLMVFMLASAGHTAKITNIDQMFEDDIGYDPSKYSEATGKLIKKICSAMRITGIDSRAVGDNGASVRSSDQTTYRMVERWMKKYNTQPFEEIFGNLVCEDGIPVMYYATQGGLCGDAYGFFRKLQELRDQGVITQDILREIILEGPVYKGARERGEVYNSWEIIKDISKIPAVSGGHMNWCPVLKEEMRKELGL